MCYVDIKPRCGKRLIGKSSIKKRELELTAWSRIRYKPFKCGFNFFVSATDVKTVFVCRKPGYAMARMTVATIQTKKTAKIIHAMRNSSLVRMDIASLVVTFVMGIVTARMALTKTRSSAERPGHLRVPLDRLTAVEVPVF